MQDFDSHFFCLPDSKSLPNFFKEKANTFGRCSLMKFTLLRWALLSAAILIATVQVRAVTIFQEDWNSGINAAKWTTQSVGGGPFTFDLGAAGLGSAGDSALFLRDASFSYSAGVRSVMNFTRAETLTTSFKLFRDQGVSLDFTSVGGPWSNTSAPSAVLPNLEDLEAGISTNQPNGSTYYVEDAPGSNDWVTTPLSVAFSSAFAAAIQKSLAIDVRVTVASTGAKIEWSVGGGPSTVEFDTLGQVAGTNWGGANTVSDTSPLRLFFGGVGNGTSHAGAVIDDIVVSAVPEPASGLLVTLVFGVAASSWRRRRS
ncbi:MAG: PEP-CTERM sorting domain-containing protein [Planctomycetota bacterium]|nr:PEP-CTERM sorting domain-containing protein [Planctomycetota bacterium]